MTNKLLFFKSKRHVAVFAFTVLALVIVVGIVVFALVKNSPNNLQPSAEPPTEGPVRIQGEAVCLPHKDTTGPQTMECAYGLKDKDGLYYALRDTENDYSNIISIPAGQQVVVTGTLKHGEDSKYRIVGTIEVTDIAPPK